ncbi:MAG TPA: tRNA 2-thiouridine(34) synthase MnmA, partial [Hyphomicrobiales bacterium]|nr:tRNA 2-thiouridine(34) synthase MnmA [Hyphomicrobiales bacterium]
MVKLPDIDRLRADLDVPGDPPRTRVVVAMSGGVDSSVVAGLVKHAGYDVVGVTLQLYDHGEAVPQSGACCAGQDIRDARRVADLIGIPHYVLDYEELFRDTVMDEFAESYIGGETPIPCVSCNQKIKFKHLLSTARELGAAALATGHYIASRRGPSGWEMHRPVDASRDQSYFLFATTPEQLSFLRFPLGGYEKSETRALAAAMGLPVADKSDSQDICFVPAGHYTDVVEKLRPGAGEPGDIVHLDGRQLGRHTGIINYTIGQRRGIGVATGEPLFVVRLDADRRQVVVGPREALSTARLWLRDVNWLGDGALEEAAANGLDIYARLRSTGRPKPATLRYVPQRQAGAVRVDLADGDDGVAPGQACVFYDRA